MDDADYPRKCYARLKRRYKKPYADAIKARVEELAAEGKGSLDYWWAIASIWAPVYKHFEQKADALRAAESEP